MKNSELFLRNSKTGKIYQTGSLHLESLNHLVKKVMVLVPEDDDDKKGIFRKKRGRI